MRKGDQKTKREHCSNLNCLCDQFIQVTPPQTKSPLTPEPLICV